MSPEEKIEMGKKLIDEAEAEIAAKKRNWPEKIEKGMCFGLNHTKAVWMATDESGLFVCIRCSGDKGSGIGVAYRITLEDFAYLGHARDLIKIADAAHEPTGAELVGKMVLFSDDGVHWTREPSLCGGYNEAGGSKRYAQCDCFAWRYARLAR